MLLQLLLADEAEQQGPALEQVIELDPKRRQGQLGPALEQVVELDPKGRQGRRQPHCALLHVLQGFALLGHGHLQPGHRALPPLEAALGFLAQYG